MFYCDIFLFMNDMICDKLDFLKFNGKWRQYQARVLKELENYLDDKKLNVVAAPGSGKTTLGIEVVSRLKNPALIIAPTITIRNQWKDRIINAFITDGSKQNLISVDAGNIQPVTIITYQRLHSIFKHKDFIDNFVSELNKNNVKTLVLDEAHHLRTEWYHSINQLIELLDCKEFTTVSLTGTPPYDVSQCEWNNYHSLCGPVDVEISIPELVKQGDLCPHQDLIWFSELDDVDKRVINDFEINRNLFFNYLNNDAEFFSTVKTSVLFDNFETNSHLIYEDTDFTVSAISYLFFHDELDMMALTLMNFLCLDKNNIPKWDYQQAQILINGILGEFNKYFDIHSNLKENLKKYNLLVTSKKVNLSSRMSEKKVITKSKNKINSIKEITKLEFESIKNDLREVILLDYIGNDSSKGMNVISVFEALKDLTLNLGILSGSLVVIPKNAKEALSKISKDINCLNIQEYCDNFLKIEAKGSYNLVSDITELFYQGYINVLVGTQSLLGEGWDSPCINCLVIASAVGSFMLSNQMRGRAIRIDKNNLQKTANIWHLVSVVKSENLDFDYKTANYDMELMYNRFKTFEGISFIDNTIQNGLERIGIPCGSIEEKNREFAIRALSRDKIKSMWTQVFEKSVITEENYVSQVYSVIKSDRVKLPVLLINNKENWCFKKIIIPLFMRYKTENFQKRTNLLIDGVINTLCDIGIFKTLKSNIKIKNIVSSDYTPYVTISDCSNYERECFIGVMEELYSSPINQRYVLCHEGKYLTVPDIIGTNKNNVKKFAKNIEPYFGYLDIIYTRTLNGRKELLKAKYNPLSNNNIKTKRIWM